MITSPRSVMDFVVSFHNVFFFYGESLILKGVNFEVAPHEFLGVIGPNGGGKTTLLKLIMGLLEPEKGKVAIFGGAPADHREKIGYVPQHLKFDKEFPMSILEMVLTGLLSRLPWYGHFNKKDKLRALEALERLGLSDLHNRSIGSVSGGQFQRALIARALVSDPKLLLLDEPTANVDPTAEANIYALLKELSKDVTIMMVTHDLHASIAHVDRVLLVHQSVEAMKAKEVCEHFAMGLYHTPLLVEQEADKGCCQRQVKLDTEG